MPTKNKTSLSGKRVLVTGAGGFIGSHLVERLVRQGAKVRAFVRYTSRSDPGLLAQLPPEILSQVEILAGDLRDADAIREAVRGCQLVFHLGALISIPYSYRHPAEVAEVNVMGTLNVLLACRDLGVERLVHTSSSEVYGTALHVPIDETHPLQGQSPYSASKIGADKLAESFFCAYDLPLVTLRPFNTYGPRQSARAVIPAIISQALTQSTVRLGNLDAARDFTFVDDTVEGFLKVAVTPGVEGRTFNLGTGQEIRIGDLARQIIALSGRPVKITLDGQRLRPEKSEVMRLLSDNTRACRSLGWQPQVSLEQGLAQHAWPGLALTWISIVEIAMCFRRQYELMKAVVLAGGKGTRLAPYTRILPKPLMPIGEMPILEVLLRQLKHAGILDVIITVGHLASLLEAYFQDGGRWGLHISYSYEDHPLGTAGPLALIEGLDEPFLTLNGDVLTTLDLRQLLAFHRQQAAAATIAMHQRQVKIDYGVIQCNGGHEIKGYIEKPSYDYLVSMGVYVFQPEVLDYIPRDQYLDFPDLVLKLIAAGQKVAGYRFEGYWQDLGRADDYQEANRDFEHLRSQFLMEE